MTASPANETFTKACQKLVHVQFWCVDRTNFSSFELPSTCSNTQTVGSFSTTKNKGIFTATALRPSVQSTASCPHRTAPQSINFSIYSTGELIQFQDCITLIFQRCLMKTVLEKAIKPFWISTIQRSPILPSLIHYQPACSPWKCSLWVIAKKLSKMSSCFNNFQCPCQPKYYQVCW